MIKVPKVYLEGSKNSPQVERKPTIVASPQRTRTSPNNVLWFEARLLSKKVKLSCSVRWTTQNAYITRVGGVHMWCIVKPQVGDVCSLNECACFIYSFSCSISMQTTACAMATCFRIQMYVGAMCVVGESI